MSETPTYQVAMEIRAVMGRKRVTQTELATLINMPVATLRRRLSGDIEISVNDLAVIAAALDVPATDLIPIAEERAS
jgi:transcriptional regulator with XRE-family HTH domain